jgi:hypothetical protein
MGSPTPVSDSPKPHLLSRYVASVKFYPTCASLQMSFMEEVISHLQALPGGIDESTARIVLENSVALKVNKPGLY